MFFCEYRLPNVRHRRRKRRPIGTQIAANREIVEQKKLSMKKILTCLLLLSAVWSCSDKAQWNREQRREMRDYLKSYRQSAYVNNLSDAEYVVFTEGVSDQLEEKYPDYKKFTRMPAMNDTVNAVVVTYVANQIAADPHNMRYIFPYDQMVGSDILPPGMNREQKRTFYACLADKVNRQWGSYSAFINQIYWGHVDSRQIAILQQECASSMTNTTGDIIETQTGASRRR